MHFISDARGVISSKCSLFRVAIIYIDITPRIPKTAKACFKCSDFEHEHVQYFYQLYILLKDQDDSELIVSIDDQVSTFKPFLCVMNRLLVDSVLC